MDDVGVHGPLLVFFVVDFYSGLSYGRAMSKSVLPGGEPWSAHSTFFAMGRYG
jgi:hypothetical protein